MTRAYILSAFLLYLVTNVQLQFLTKTNQCPVSCFCVNLDSSVMCKKAGLSELPDGIDNQTTILDFAMNKFETVPYGLAELTELKFLNLSYNFITSLNQSSLQGLTKLRLLDLSHNMIKAWTDIHPHSLMGALVLDELDLSYNNLGNFPEGVPDYPIKSVSVTRLHLNNCSMTSFLGQYLFEMTALKELHMSRNNLLVLNTPIQAKSLQVIDMTECNLQKIHSNVFSQLPDLFLLILSKNYFLKKFSSSSTSLQFLDLSNCNLESLPSGKLPKLRNINLVGNYLRNIPANAFKSSPSIERLYMSNNAIKTVDLNAFNDIPNLQHLDLSYNTISNLEMDTFAQNSELNVLNLSHNYIRSIGQLVVPSLKWLDLSSCEIQTVPGNSLLLMPELQYLNLTRNLIFHMPDNIEAPNLSVLDLSMCGIFSVNNKTFAAMPHLRVLNLSGNRLTSGIKPSFFYGVTDIKLDVNPWYCNCSSKDFHDLYYWLFHEIYSLAIMRCGSPEHLAGKTWEYACHEQWFIPEKNLPPHMWLYSTSVIVVMVTLCLVVMVLKHINKRKQALRREAEEREREEARERLRRMQRSAARSRESINRNAPDPFHQLPPSYVEAISMPRLDISCSSLANRSRSLHSLQSTSSQPEGSSRRSKTRYKRRRRSKAGLRDSVASETQSAVSLSHVNSDSSS